MSKHKLWAKVACTFAVCAMGTVCMIVTNGDSGVGWAIFGLAIIWG